ncbi:hypothetical protein ACCO45_010421 [Purpureocillium lilacinum]|uniref:Uncharacterized protein n=1 Tax=Purpureocillium lilacinum TaxID=33203 RepID=A0ACC4DFQ8_PURLI
MAPANSARPLAPLSSAATRRQSCRASASLGFHPWAALASRRLPSGACGDTHRSSQAVAGAATSMHRTMIDAELDEDDEMVRGLLRRVLRIWAAVATGAWRRAMSSAEIASHRNVQVVVLARSRDATAQAQ